MRYASIIGNTTFTRLWDTVEISGRPKKRKDFEAKSMFSAMGAANLGAGSPPFLRFERIAFGNVDFAQNPSLSLGVRG